MYANVHTHTHTQHAEIHEHRNTQHVNVYKHTKTDTYHRKEGRQWQTTNTTRLTSIQRMTVTTKWTIRQRSKRRNATVLGSGHVIPPVVGIIGQEEFVTSCNKSRILTKIVLHYLSTYHHPHTVCEDREGEEGWTHLHR